MESENANRAKLPYEPPDFETEEAFETTALVCNKMGGGCTGGPGSGLGNKS